MRRIAALEGIAPVAGLFGVVVGRLVPLVLGGKRPVGRFAGGQGGVIRQACYPATNDRVGALFGPRLVLAA